MTSPLEEQASAFARTLTEVCRSTVASTADFAFQKLEGSAVGWVAQSGTTTPTRPALISLDGTAASPLWLRVRFTVEMDCVDEFLAIEASTFGLCINDETGRCAIRIEYERGRGSEPGGDEDARRHSRPAAHVHVHGASPELGYVWGALRRPLRSLDKLHIPVGGRRFRPTLEDFIEFLEAEQLLPETKPGWRDVIAASRQEYLDNQLRAAVRSHPEVAVERLRSMGYFVQQPDP